MTNDNNIWTRHITRVVDQRKYRLPPTWVSLPKQSNAQAESGRNIHISGRNRELANRVTSLIARTTQKIVLSSFLLADQEIEQAILEAAKRRVRVYVLLASEARLDIGDVDDECENAMYEQHEDMLNRLGGYAFFRSAPHFHAKFVLSDPGFDNSAGLLLTANLTKEALERNQEMAVDLTRDEVEKTYALARWAFWEFAEHELIDPNDNFRAIKPLGLIQHPPPTTNILSTTSELVQLREESVRLIESAQKEILVACFGWGENHEIIEYLCIRASEGLPVTVLARIRESQMSTLLTLAESGARVLGFNWLHAKAVCVDGDTALVMSANLQSDGLDHGFELGVTLNGDCALEVRERLLGWSDVAHWELLASPVIGDLSGAARIWQDSRLELTNVKAEACIDLGTVIAESADELDDTAPPPLPPGGNMPELAYEVVYEWRVQAPVLAANSKQVFRSTSDKKTIRVPFDPPVFDEPSSRRVVAINSPNDIGRARQVANDSGAKAFVLRQSSDNDFSSD